MTLHQFIYLLVFVPIGFAVYRIIPIPFLNIVLGFIISSIGLLLAFLPVNDRPLDVFLKNLYKRLTSPTQYLYRKTNKPISFLNGNQPTPDSQKTKEHLDSQEKLSKYLHSKSTQQTISQAVAKTTAGIKTALNEPPPKISATKLSTETIEKIKNAVVPEIDEHQPFFMGVVKNNREKPLPEILVYVKDESNVPVRLLKTNPHGVFATYSSLPQGEYSMEAKDPRGSYLFDTMKISLSASNPAPFTMLSKGLL